MSKLVSLTLTGISCFKIAETFVRQHIGGKNTHHYIASEGRRLRLSWGNLNMESSMTTSIHCTVNTRLALLDGLEKTNVVIYERLEESRQNDYFLMINVSKNPQAISKIYFVSCGTC